GCIKTRRRESRSSMMRAISSSPCWHARTSFLAWACANSALAYFRDATVSFINAAAPWIFAYPVLRRSPAEENPALFDSSNGAPVFQQPAPKSRLLLCAGPAARWPFPLLIDSCSLQKAAELPAPLP